MSQNPLLLVKSVTYIQTAERKRERNTKTETAKRDKGRTVHNKTTLPCPPPTPTPPHPLPPPPYSHPHILHCFSSWHTNKNLHIFLTVSKIAYLNQTPFPITPCSLVFAHQDSIFKAFFFILGCFLVFGSS